MAGLCGKDEGYERLEGSAWCREGKGRYVAVSGLLITTLVILTTVSDRSTVVDLERWSGASSQVVQGEGETPPHLAAVKTAKEWKKSANDPSTFARLKEVRYSGLSEEETAELFQKYALEFGKAYADEEEEAYRYEIFSKNLGFIDLLNAQNPRALFGLNMFADQSEDERKRRRMRPQNLTQVQAALASVIGHDMVEAAKQGAFAHGRDYRADNRRQLLQRKSWLDGLALSQGEATSFSQSQGEFAWASASDCAACKKYPAFGEYSMGNVPENFDWRTLGAVTDVKNQAYCGSCWSFSTAADVEGAWYLATGELTSRSPQQLVECNTMNMGCDGGYPFAAMQYLSHLGGMLEWDDLPYEKIVYGDAEMNPVGTPKCAKTLINEKLRTKNVAHIAGWQMVGMGDAYEALMRVYMVKNGPLSISFNANGMDYYIHGVVGCSSEDDCAAGSISHPDTDGQGDMFTCDPTSLDHAVLLVGYGVQQTDPNGDLDYWVIKNSWGDAWGEDGYYRLIRGVNACGVANNCVHSVIKQPDDLDQGEKDPPSS